MNTGIGDAVNLAWKIAAVSRGRANGDLLDTYDPERIAFARRLIATTDRGFTIATRDGPIARHVRLKTVPRVVPALMARTAVRRFLFRTVSQTLVNYRHCPWSEGKAGSLRGGDRLPWLEGTGSADNFAPLASVDWQLHVYGNPPPDLVATCARRGLPLHAFPWQPGAGKTGLTRDAAYLVRPDGYIGLVDRSANSANLEKYLDAHALRFA
jgi:hypothetical protein